MDVSCDTFVSILMLRCAGQGATRSHMRLLTPGWMDIQHLREMVPRRGLEPPRIAPLVPETSASTSSATWAGGRLARGAGIYAPNRGLSISARALHTGQPQAIRFVNGSEQ